MDNKDIRYQDITICIMTYDDAITLSACIKRLMYQDIIPNIIVLDAGSYDGGPEMLQKQIDNKFWQKANIKLVREDYNKMGKTERRATAYDKLASLTDTKYIFFVNPKLLLPPFCIVPLIKQMDNDKELGLLGIRGPIFMNDNHVCIDPAILRTEDAKKITFEGRLDRCICRNAHPYFRSFGKKIEYNTEYIASYMKTLYEWG